MLSYTKGKIIELLQRGTKGARRVFGLSLVYYKVYNSRYELDHVYCITVYYKVYNSRYEIPVDHVYCINVYYKVYNSRYEIDHVYCINVYYKVYNSRYEIDHVYCINIVYLYSKHSVSEDCLNRIR